ncbi:MAG: 6-hydroxymethylpterin diphosphokinase MptE-like protein [Treponema sp.]
MTQYEENKPCPVKTAQGFSVKYKGRFLYSKYNPSANILRSISSLNILPGTLILCISPCLCYGIEELAAILPEDCFLAGCERDEELFKIAEEACKNFECCKSGKFVMLKNEELFSLPEKINGYYGDNVFKCKAGTFRRAVKIDFSAGADFYSDFYADLFAAVTDSIGRFWKNRLTLIKFGKRYSRNFFLNLSQSTDSYSLPVIRKPILVAGAGESLERTVAELAKNMHLRENFFIISVDAALQSLQEAKIIPDAVICEECQNAISAAFIGCKNLCRYAFLSLSSCFNTSAAAADKSCFYATLFEDRRFIRSLSEKSLLPPIIPPLGSVGLSAVYIASIIRFSDDVPIFITGLDFSYSCGKTHSIGTFQDRIKRSRINRLLYTENFGAAFGYESHKVNGKDGKTAVSTAVLREYSKTFIAYFSRRLKNCFDIGRCGLSLELPSADLIDSEKFYANLNEKILYEEKERLRSPEKEKLIMYFTGEKNALEELKSIFTGEIKFSKKETDEKIKSLLTEREYLFLHFPDGINPSVDVGFLNRVRPQIDYFLKIFAICLNILNKRT